MPYDPDRHGLWEIAMADGGTLVVRLAQEATAEPELSST